MKNLSPSIAAIALIVGSTLASFAGAQNNTAGNPASAHAGHDHGTSATAATTSNPSRSADADFVELDTNKDGFIAKSELSAKHPLLPHFAMADQDKNGKLDKKEFAAGMAML